MIYVGSSDPREGGGGGGGKGDLGLDTNSGDPLAPDLDRHRVGEARPRARPAAVGGEPLDERLLLTTDPETGHRILLAAQGGNTNAGAPSQNFAYASETALSAAILKIDLTELESGAGEFAVKTDGAHQYVYDLPTVMGEPLGMGVFGGRDGLNQARLVEGGPVSIYSSGWRNPYDIVLTEDGDIFTIDNGANQGWGGLPTARARRTSPTSCPTATPTGSTASTTSTISSSISGRGYYGGHPNPIRANPTGAGITYTDASGAEVWSQNPGGAWPPLDPSFAFPDDGDFLLPGVEDGALIDLEVLDQRPDRVHRLGVRGCDEGQPHHRRLRLLDLPHRARSLRRPATQEAIASGLNGIPLDVVAQGEADLFPGTIWIGYVAGNAEIEVLVPTYASGTPDDLDGDGYSNSDETANGTNPNNPCEHPARQRRRLRVGPQRRGRRQRWLFDPVDHFALDELNGTASSSATPRRSSTRCATTIRAPASRASASPAG